jgi:replicative DNA helicase
MAQDRTIPEFDQKLDTLGENELHALLRRIACAIVDLAPDSGADAIEEIEAAFGAEVVDVIIDKSRGGREGRTAIVFWPQTSSFAPITRDGYEAHLAQQRAAFEAAGGGRKGRR